MRRPSRRVLAALCAAVALCMGGVAHASLDTREAAVSSPSPLWTHREATEGVEQAAANRQLHHTHVDAGHVGWDEEKNQPDVFVVLGHDVVPTQGVTVRVGPDADQKTGREASRIRVPHSPALRFLGQPGTILWNAPATYYKDWAPVWSGLGAGSDIPTSTIVDSGSITLELVGVKGPGWISIWTGDEGPGGIDGHEYITTREPGKTTLKSPAGGHGHFNWSFSKPGHYTMTWRATMKTYDGRTLTSPERDIEWLVGTDEDLGLPQGTWKQHYEITTPAEQFDIGQPADEGAGTPGETTIPRGEEAELWDAESAKCLAPGHYDIAYSNAVDKDPKGAMSAVIRGTGDQTFGSYEAVIPVPDSLKRQLNLTERTKELGVLGPQGTTVWQLPETQNPAAPWFGFSTEGMDMSQLGAPGLPLQITGLTGPGRIVSFTSDVGTGVHVHNDSKDEFSSYRFFEPTHLHLGLAFNQPGLYELSWQAKAEYIDDAGNPAQGWVKNDYADPTIYYVVGNERINEVCPGWLEKYGVSEESAPAVPDAEPKPEPETEPENTRESEEPASAETPAETTVPTEPAAPQPAPVCTTQDAPVDSTATLTFVVGQNPAESDSEKVATHGHFDLGPVISGKDVSTLIKDDRQIPAQWVKAQSLVFHLGEKARLVAPEALNFVAPTGDPVWLIGSTQQQDVPWVGVNTQDQGLLKTTTRPVQFTLEELKGPGKIGLFQTNAWGNGVEKVLWNKPGDHFDLPLNTHAHYNWVFGAPGVYTVTVKTTVIAPAETCTDPSTNGETPAPTPAPTPEPEENDSTTAAVEATEPVSDAEGESPSFLERTITRLTTITTALEALHQSVADLEGKFRHTETTQTTDSTPDATAASSEPLAEHSADLVGTIPARSYTAGSTSSVFGSAPAVVSGNTAPAANAASVPETPAAASTPAPAGEEGFVPAANPKSKPNQATQAAAHESTGIPIVALLAALILAGIAVALLIAGARLRTQRPSEEHNA